MLPSAHGAARRPGAARPGAGERALLRRVGCTQREAPTPVPLPAHIRLSAARLPLQPGRQARPERPAALAVAAASSAGASPGASNGPSLVANWSKGWQLAGQAAALVRRNAWAVLVLFAASDAAIFAMHRVCHRLVNEVAIRCLLPSQLRSAQALGGSLWWLSGNADVANFQTGYQWLALLGFLAMLPISVLLRTFAAATSLLIAADSLSQEGEQHARSWLPPAKQVGAQLRRQGGAAWRVIARLWQVDLLVAVRAIPLQFMCLLLVPIPWVLPRLLNLQLALPLSLFEGERGDDAVRASQRTVQPVRGALAAPFVGLLLASKLLAFLGRVFLTQLPARVARDVPEIPIGVYLAVGAATLVLSRVQDMLPLATYVEAKKAYGFQAELRVAP